MGTAEAPATIDAYIGQFPAEQQEIMTRVRELVHSACPDVEEKISWAMPTFAYHGNLVHFAMHAKHLGFYPGPDAIVAFADRLAGYKTSKGAVQFPLDREMPYGLMEDIVRRRVAEVQGSLELQ